MAEFVGLSNRPAGARQGSTKWLSWLSEITEILISHKHFSLEITYNIPKIGYFEQYKFMSQKQVNETQQLSLTYTNFLHKKNLIPLNKFLSDKNLENKFPSQNINYVTVSVKKTQFCHTHKKKFLSRKQISATHKNVCQIKSFCHRSKLIGT